MINIREYQSKLIVIITVLLFAITVYVLNSGGYVPDKKQFVLPTPNPNEEQNATVAINPVDIAGQVIFTKAAQLYALEPVSKAVTALVTTPPIEAPGILADGRLYYWQKEGSSYKRLYIQKGSVFEKIMVPVEKNDGGLGVDTPPIVSPDGSYVVFTSDRDAKDNYRRRSLYQYDLSTLQLIKLTNNTFMTVYEPFISPDAQYIGFTYQNLEPNKGASPTALGVVINGTKSPNLFPKVFVTNLSIAFMPDTKLIVFTGQQGTSLFNIEEGKVTDTISSGTFRAVSADGFLVIEGGSGQVKTTFSEACFKDKPVDGPLPMANDISLYKYENSKVTKVASFVSPEYSANVALEYPYHTFGQDQQVLIEYLDKDHCQRTKGILDFSQKTITPLDEIGNNAAFWAGGK